MEPQDSVANNFIVATYMDLESPIKNVWRHQINQKALKKDQFLGLCCRQRYFRIFLSHCFKSAISIKVN